MSLVQQKKIGNAVHIFFSKEIFVFLPLLEFFCHSPDYAMMLPMNTLIQQ